MLIRHTVAAISMVSLVAATAACGAEEDGGLVGSPAAEAEVSERPSAADSITTSDAPAVPPADTSPGTTPSSAVPPFPKGTAPAAGNGSGEPDLVLVDVRVAKHVGFDRIVLEFAGTGSPGWQVNYVDEAILDGSGEVVALGGDSTLDVYASGTTYDPTDPYRGRGHLEPPTGSGLEDVYVVGTFEGNTQVLVGTPGDPAPFRVFALTQPARLVIDVAAHSRH
jgi:hypothetical protein